MVRGHARPLWVLAAAALMAGCASTQFINTWKDPNYVGGPFKKIVVPAAGYYRDFYGYYSSAWTYYTPPQMYQYDVVTLETNLWDVTKESLVWSATTETFAPGEFRREVAAFSDLVVGALREKRLI